MSRPYSPDQISFQHPSIRSHPEPEFAALSEDSDDESSDEKFAACRHAYQARGKSPRNHTPESCSSGESMKKQVIETPPESPLNSDSLDSSSDAAPLARLSLGQEHRTDQKDDWRSRSFEATITGCKRVASPEPSPPNKRSPAGPSRGRIHNDLRGQTRASAPSRGRGNHSKPQIPRHHSEAQHSHRHTLTSDQDRACDGEHPVSQRPPTHQDSGYQSQPSRQPTVEYHTSDKLPVIEDDSAVVSLPSNPVFDTKVLQNSSARDHADQSSQTYIKRRHPGMILQPESSPISKEQLAAEVKGIYNGLVTVEAKCISIDSGEAADAHSKLSDEQWQALVALHRTLLYEHHDFLMATQHPSATPALRGLAVKYSMPARMWKHGIHSFLEVLRHRRPDSQEYMLGFLILSYQMMTLLFETIPTFTDTWIECLGDLARYRMAIEEGKEAQSTWGSVAARWYNTASDRHPSIGRLYHHLGILERLGLPKFFLFAKSLTCLIPFNNARESLRTVCGPIVKGTAKTQDLGRSVEARVVGFHAHVFVGSDHTTTMEVASDTLAHLYQQPAEKLRPNGVELMVTNFASLMEYGLPSNQIWDLFLQAINATVHASRPSVAHNTGLSSILQRQGTTLGPGSTTASLVVHEFCYKTLALVTSYRNHPHSLYDSLASFHTGLVWFHGIVSLRPWISTDDLKLFHSLLDIDSVWPEICCYLNELSKLHSISARIIQFARQGKFPTPENQVGKPLPEDYSIRGLTWTHFYFPSDWFKGQVNEEADVDEALSTRKSRVERVQWLGLYISFHSTKLRFDDATRQFLHESSPVILPRTLEPESKYVEAVTPWNLAPAVAMPHSDSSPKASRWSTPNKAARKPPVKARQDYTEVRIANEGWSTECEP